MTTLLFLLGGIIGALLVAFAYMTLAAKAVANHQDRVMSLPLIGPDLDAFLRALHGAAGACVVEGNAVEVFQNGDEIFPPMLAAIRESQSTIHFSTYVYWAGAVPREFAQALAEAAQRGVMVRLVLDSKGTEPMPRELVNQMRHASCKITWFRRMQWFDWMKYNQRTHRRLLIVDGKIGFTGGVGIADEWTGHAQSPSHWRDTNVRLTGPIVGWSLGATRNEGLGPNSICSAPNLRRAPTRPEAPTTLEARKRFSDQCRPPDQKAIGESIS